MDTVDVDDTMLTSPVALSRSIVPPAMLTVLLDCSRRSCSAASRMSPEVATRSVSPPELIAVVPATLNRKLPAALTFTGPEGDEMATDPPVIDRTSLATMVRSSPESSATPE